MSSILGHGGGGAGHGWYPVHSMRLSISQRMTENKFDGIIMADLMLLFNRDSDKVSWLDITHKSSVWEN